MLEKLKSLSRDTLIYGTNTIIGRFLNFILVPFYTNMFLPAEFGVVAILYSYIAILNVFFSIGLESGYMKFASTGEAGTVKQNFSNPYLLVFFNSLILSGFIFIFASDLTGIFQIGESYSYLIKYSALILFFDTLILIPFAYLRLNNKAKSFAGIKTLNIVINVVLNLVLILKFKFGIEAVFISNLAASFITFIILIPLVLRNMDLTFNKQLVSELLRFSLPYIPAGIAANIVQIIDRPILKYLTDDKTVGIYQANYRLGIFMMLIVAMFEYAWRPFFLNNAKEPNAKSIFSKVLTYFLTGGSFIFLIITIFINDVVKMDLPFGFHLIGKSYWEGLSIVPVILFAYLLNGMYVNFMAGIYIEKKTKYLPLISGLGAVSNVIANFILIPEFSYMGAALATLISYLVMMSGLFYVSNKFYKIDYEYKNIGFIFLSLFVCTALYYLSAHNFNLPWFLNIVFPLLFVVLIFSFRVVDLKQLKKMS
ncbi:MAG TPA: oligosaccharide flippase family protein [Ignavibacteria bacterium]|nr:oligosaccharide flippase family protein [Ignavibacteria bacterium]HMR39945.1 oligosaccharide flippase family protein [Ignavibacteria bacterium]